MITDAQLLAWLKDGSAIRCVLMEVGVLTGGVETTRYLSNKGYVTGASDTPANTIYSAVIAGGIKFTESLSLDGSPSLSYGDIEIYNTSGEKDAWLDDIWRNRPVKIYIGDLSWARSDFRLIFDGIVTDIGSRSRERLNLKLGDKFQKLNTPVSENKLGGTTSNKDRLIPLLFGECHNIEPLLVDPSNHEYQVHGGPIERIIEVRDNGVPVAFTPDLSTGKFRLNQQPFGTITCSAQGDKTTTYVNDVANIIKRIVTGYGSTSQLTLSDIDVDSFAAFSVDNPQPVGIYLKDRTNVIDCCNKLAQSVGARVAMSRTGLLYLVKIDLPRESAGSTVTSSDIVERSLYVSQLPSVVAGVQLGYCKNWTVQNSLQTGLPEEHISLYATEWLTVTATDPVVAAAYNIHTEPTMEETMLLTEADASAESSRRLGLFKVQRKVFHFNGYPQFFFEKLGSSMTIVNNRFNLSNGATGQIISIVTDWIDPHVEMEVLV